MSKYIIDIPKTVGMLEAVGSVHYTYFDGIQCKTIILKSDEIEELNSDYINEHYGSLQDEAYKRGINDGSLDVKQRVEGAYQQGLDDAWEAAGKIADMWTRIGNDELLAIFGITERIGHSTIRSLFEKQTANEAMLELETYEEKQNDKIEVGDTVDLKDAVSDKGCGIVTKIFDNDYCYIVWSDGSGGAWAKNMLVKTGKHIDIASILEDMRND